MNKNLLLLQTLFFCYCFGVQAQSEKYKWAAGININSVEPIQDINWSYGLNLVGGTGSQHRKDKSTNFGLFVSFKPKQYFGFRLSAKLTNYNIEGTLDTREGLPFTASQYYTSSSKVESSIINISPGVQWLFNYKILNLYGGFELVYKKYNDVTIESHFLSYETSTNNLISENLQTINATGGFSFGMGYFAGFTINVLKRIAVGAEIYSSFSYYKLGGDVQIVDTSPITGNTSTQTWQATSEGYKFSNINSAIHLSVAF